MPPDNPFVGVDGARPEIWAIGFRNPWRYSFDRSTGDLWVSDVGQNQWEEVDVAWAADGGGKGANYGWSAMEGNHVFNADQSADGAIPPMYEYEHVGQDCSISGSALYRGTAIPALVGYYVFADYCRDRCAPCRSPIVPSSRWCRSERRTPSPSARAPTAAVVSGAGPIYAVTPG